MTLVETFSHLAVWQQRGSPVVGSPKCPMLVQHVVVSYLLLPLLMLVSLCILHAHATALILNPSLTEVPWNFGSFGVQFAVSAGIGILSRQFRENCTRCTWVTKPWDPIQQPVGYGTEPSLAYW